MTDPADVPIRASKVPLNPDAFNKTSDQVQRERTTKAVRARQVRKEALRRTGALDGSESADLATRLEARVKGIERRATSSFQAQQAVRAMRARNRSDTGGSDVNHA